MLVICVAIPGAGALPLQDIGGTLAFQGQDIIGGAAIIFKAPKRVRDLAGNTAAMLAARRPSRSNRPTEVARNNRPAAQPTSTAVATTTTENRAEALKDQAYLASGGDYWPFASSTSRRVDYDHPTPYDPDGRPSATAWA